ncbi:hypothetical protein [Thalassotalea marina]|uniref:Uncharacterized protein n=1 Tax=Thalassotalea marina TaxID=1673741 RepID=A0A919BQY0_9GAMM|nr:hypothetical protein [Thalassotalea marina]GHG07184.1 hypothetical protein GCM10017161_41130 [Thalassotalea marina]
MFKFISSLLFSALVFGVVAEEVPQTAFFGDKNAFKQPKDQGCYIGKTFYPVGTRKSMNHVELALYLKKTGYQASDGYAVMMRCLYLVDPLSDDHPLPKDRKFVWVAS